MSLVTLGLAWLPRPCLPQGSNEKHIDQVRVHPVQRGRHQVWDFRAMVVPAAVMSQWVAVEQLSPRSTVVDVFAGCDVHTWQLSCFAKGFRLWSFRARAVGRLGADSTEFFPWVTLWVNVGVLALVLSFAAGRCSKTTSGNGSVLRRRGGGRLSEPQNCHSMLPSYPGDDCHHERCQQRPVGSVQWQ